MINEHATLVQQLEQDVELYRRCLRIEVDAKIKYRDALLRVRDYLNKYAGPVGCGYELGSWQHHCNIERDAIDKTLQQHFLPT